MSDKKDLVDEIGFYAFLYSFWKPMLVIAIIVIAVFIWGYYKFAVPVYNEYDERMSNWKIEEIYFYSATSGEKIIYADINPMRIEIARSIDDNGHILPGKKDRVAELSEELIVNMLGARYRIEEVEEDGKKYFRYYIDDIRIKDMYDAANMIESRIMSLYVVESEKEMNS